MLAARSLVIASGLSLLWCVDAHGQRPTMRNGLRADVLGCYALYSGPARVGNSLYNASPSVRLDSLRVGTLGPDTVPGVLRAMVPLTVSNEPMTARRGPPSWMADSLSDTVRLSFVDGFSGAVFVLEGAGGGH